MARRYGAKIKTARKWKKIAKMNKNELLEFKKHLEKFNQFTSDVYSVVINSLNVKYGVV